LVGDEGNERPNGRRSSRQRRYTVRLHQKSSKLKV